MKIRIFILIVSLAAFYYGGRLVARNIFLTEASPPPEIQEKTEGLRFGKESLELSRQLPPDKQDDYSRTVRNMSSAQKKEELARLVGEGKGKNENQIRTLLKEWAKSAPREALMELAQVGGDYYRKYLDVIIRTWASRNPEGAAAYYLENRDSLIGTRVIDNIVHVWAKSDLDAAWKWLDAREDLEKKKSMAMLLFMNEAVLAGRMNDFMPHIMDMTWNDSYFINGISTALYVWSVCDPDEMEQFLAVMPLDKKKVIAENMFADFLFGRDLDKAAPFLALMDSSEVRGFMGWDRFFETKEGEKAMDWVMHHLAEEDFNHLVKEGDLVFHSLDDCFSWVKKQTNVSLRDNMISSFIKRDMTANYERSMEMIGMVTESALRDTLIEQNFKNWVNRDISAAQKWVHNSSLPRVSKSRLERIIKELH